MNDPIPMTEIPNGLWIFLKDALIKSARAYSERFCFLRKFGKARNTVCISGFPNCTEGAKDLLLRKLWLNRLALTARDFGSAESSKNGGILYVFPVFRTARMGQNIRCSAADDLFRGSLAFCTQHFAFFSRNSSFALRPAFCHRKFPAPMSARGKLCVRSFPAGITAG